MTWYRYEISTDLELTEVQRQQCASLWESEGGRFVRWTMDGRGCHVLHMDWPTPDLHSEWFCVRSVGAVHVDAAPGVH